MNKTVYSFHPDTGAYLARVELGASDLSPVDLANGEHIWLIPAHSLEIAPPDIPSGKVAVARDGAWELIDAPLAVVEEAPTIAEHVPVPATSEANPEAHEPAAEALDADGNAPDTSEPAAEEALQPEV